MRRKSPQSQRPAKVAKVPREKREPRHGLRDMFIDRPGGIAGQIMSMVWGDSEAEFAEIATLEAQDQQRRRPDRFTNKIKPRTGGGGTSGS